MGCRAIPCGRSPRVEWSRCSAWFLELVSIIFDSLFAVTKVSQVPDRQSHTPVSFSFMEVECLDLLREMAVRAVRLEEVRLAADRTGKGRRPEKPSHLPPANLVRPIAHKI
jgi:hypothetical protein